MTIEDLKGKKIAFLGLGVNNQGLAQYLKNKGVDFEVIENWKKPDDLVGKIMDFEVVFRVVDLLNKKPPPRLAKIASELRLGSSNLEQNVQAKREIFAHLADMFSIPL